MKRLKVDIVIPVYYGNLKELEPSIIKQLEFYNKKMNNYDWKIVIGINGKKEGIVAEAKRLCEKYPNVTYDYTPNPGKGHSIKKTFMESNADIVSFMDVDLSTDLISFPKLIKYVAEGYDLVSGSRYVRGSKCKRGFKRTFLSKVYINIFLKWFLKMKSTDPQCGFKAMKQESAEKLFPLVEDSFWFFETEMVYISEKLGYKIKDIPIRWTESPFASGVKIFMTAISFMIKTIKLKYRDLKITHE